MSCKNCNQVDELVDKVAALERSVDDLLSMIRSQTVINDGLLDAVKKVASNG